MPNRIADSLTFLEQQMQSELGRVRAALQHGGNKGASLESTLRSFLRSYLPAHNKVGQGEVIDSFGAQSGQLDVIISNTYHPPMNLEEQPSPHFIEGVSAAGEVKAALRHNDIDVIISSCLKFKQLQPHFQKGIEVYSNPEDLERFVDHRPYFVFGFDSEIKIEALQKRLTETYVNSGTPIHHQVDAVFLLGHGSVINFGKGTGNLTYKTGEKSLAGIHAISSDKQGVLSLLLGWYALVTPEIKLRDNPISRYMLHSPN